MPVIIVSPTPVVIPAIQPLPAAPSAGDGASSFAAKAAAFFEGLASMVAQYNLAGSGYGAMTPLPPRPTDRSAGFAAESDTFLAGLPNLVSEVNAKIAQLSLPTAPVSALPDVPDRVDDPTNFATESALFLAALGSLGGQLGGFVTAFNAYAPSVSSFAIVGPGTVTEGSDAGITFTVHRSGAISQAAIINWAVQAVSAGLNASDFGEGALPSGTLNFVPDQRSASITLFINDDTSVEGSETFRVAISGAAMGGGAAANITQNIATATITDNDTGSAPGGVSTFSIAAPSPATINEGPKSTSTNFVFTVSRTGALTQAAYVDWAVSGSGADPATPIDFGLAAFPSGTLLFAANESSKSLIVSVKGDTLVEPDEGFTITLSNPRMADATPGALGAGSASATIANDDSTSSSGEDDVASFSISAPSTANEGQSGTTIFTFPVTRAGGLSFAAAVDYAVSGSGGSAAAASDFAGGVFPTGTLGFSAGQATANINIQVQGDTAIEPDEGFTVSLLNPRTFGTLSSASASSTILNDDAGSTYLPAVGSAPLAAFGAKRIVTGYSGALLTLRRSSDNATSDFGPTGGSDFLDYSAISTWAGGSDLFVSKFFDQTGNGRHLIQSTAGSQPGFDLTQGHGGCSPIHFSNSTLSYTDGSSIFDRRNSTYIEICAERSVTTNRAHFTFLNGSSVVHSLYGPYPSTYNATDADTSFATGGEFRAQPAAVALTSNASEHRLFSRETQLTLGAPSAGSGSTVTLGDLVGFGGFKGAHSTWAVVLYPALSTGDTNTVLAALRTAFSVPTSFTSRIVFQGDSIMEGALATNNKNLVQQLSLHGTPELFNVALSGSKLSEHYADRANRPCGPTAGVNPLYTSAYGAGKCVLVIQSGTNDLAAGTTASSLYSTLTSFVTAEKTLGFKVVVASILPRQNGVAGWTSGMDAERVSYNASVVGNAAAADAVINVADTSTTMGNPATTSNGTYYGDGLHPTSAGYVLLAPLYSAGINTLI